MFKNTSPVSEEQKQDNPADDENHPSDFQASYFFTKDQDGKDQTEDQLNLSQSSDIGCIFDGKGSKPADRTQD